MTIVRCVATRKDGKPCQGVGLIFDPHWNGKVCDAHLSDPRLSPRKMARLSGMIQVGQRIADEARAEAQRRREYVSLGLSEDGLRTLSKKLRKFRDGSPLKPKTRKLLEAILRDHQWRESERKQMTREMQGQKESPGAGDAANQ